MLSLVVRPVIVRNLPRACALSTPLATRTWGGAALPRVLAPCSFYSPQTTPAPEGADLGSLKEKDAFRQVQGELASHTTPSMPMKDYLNVCQTYGIDSEKAKELLSSLSKSGTVLHFPSSAQLADTIFVKPDMVTESIFQALSVPADGLLNAGQKESLERLKSLDSLKMSLDTKAERITNLKVLAGFGYLTAQFGVLARLTWWEFSWDVIEPVTYFITFGTGILSYIYFMISRKEYTYESMREGWVRKKREKLYRKNQIDLGEYERLKSRFGHLLKDVEK